jgi:glycosyltransferase involved in cell wall biosynthesis/peptidoglycan/xylan/chitin deacetylase (PgdA/CDA1 family)
MADALKISVVVPTHNRRDVLVSRTLPAIFDQDLPATEYEVIVVVDGSTDGTAQALRELHSPCSLRIIEQANSGPSAARNRGIQAAKGGLLLFIDDDILCSPSLLKMHVEAHGGLEAAVVYGPISLAPETPPSILKYAIEDWYKKYYGHLDAQNGVRWPQDDYLISNSSLPRATLIACGGFDENMPAKEDYELGFRLWKMGLRFKYLPQARASEFYVKPSRYVLSNDGRSFGKTEVLLSRKHPEYRPYSALAVLGKVTGWRRLWQRFYVELPVAPVGLLAPAIWVCDKLCRFPRMRKAGHYLLGVGRGVVEFRSAAEEVGSLRALQREFGARLPVLLYSHVGPSRPGIEVGSTVSPERFGRHVSWLAQRGYTGIHAADWVRWRRDGTGLPDQPVLFTFDNGDQDLTQYALPVLRHYGFGGIVFLVASQLGGVAAWRDGRGSGGLNSMTSEQLRYWASQGIEFGIQGRDHADSPTLSAEELEEEVDRSKRELESCLGSSVTSFAYPHGLQNRAVYDRVRRAYDLAFIVDCQNKGLNHLQTDPHLLSRIEVQSTDSVVALECRARWGYSPFHKLRVHNGERA